MELPDELAFKGVGLEPRFALRMRVTSQHYTKRLVQASYNALPVHIHDDDTWREREREKDKDKNSNTSDIIEQLTRG